MKLLDYLHVVGSLMLLLGVYAYLYLLDPSMDTVYGLISGLGFGCIVLSIIRYIRSATA